MQTVKLPPLFTPPAPDSPVPSVPFATPLPDIHVTLFRNIRNAIDVRNLVIKGDPRVPECVLINAATIVDVFQIQMACTKALLHQQQGIMRTRSLYSEILFNLSPTNNISDAIRQFGISDTTTAVAVVMVGMQAPPEEVRLRLLTLIEGEPIPLSQLQEFTDLPLINRIYKTGNAAADRGQTLALVVGAMALKGHLS
ncbi:hypothetical protein SpCBS45565_g00080 [Spizellomyces sp. 'palustris']|nr:hypothetical protein SpCBS45565_g00080 [Spizellomyces sp. 'palustris']